MAELNFEVDDNTIKLMTSIKGELLTLSVERVTNELYNGYKALERYFEEISKFYSPIC